MSDSTPPVEESDAILGSHSYDGIQEYDNPTPGWWNWIFIGSVIFAPLYVIWFHSPVLDHDLKAQYETGKAANLKLQFGKIGDLEPNRANMLKYLNDEEWLPVGKAVFASNCATCHGPDAGGGSSAPNLTDDHYLHVKQIEDISKVIREGAKNNAMPAWGSKLHTNEVLFVACYVAQLRGTNVPGGKAEDSKAIEIDPWPEYVPEAEEGETNDGSAELKESKPGESEAEASEAEESKPEGAKDETEAAAASE